jgi:3D-(3,5/4)-trihydroxycyclohexane-1,2-dione acylhydrolase (decyclizing)
VTTIRLTTAQALVRFLTVQYSERDGTQQRLVDGCFGILGHGNVAGLGEALQQHSGELPFHQARNEQAMVHAAVAYARVRGRLSTMACTTSVGPGATNLVTGAALATINRLPVLLLPGDVFATRASGTVLQQLEAPQGHDVSVNDALRPVSASFDRVWRPEQLPSVLMAAMRVLTDPAATGAVTIALPQDVQAEAFDWPVELFDRRVWRIGRQVPEPDALHRAVAAIRSSSRPLVVAGGGVVHSRAWDALRVLVEATGLPVAQTQAGKGVLPDAHPQSVGGIGVTGTSVANDLAGSADLVIGVGTRWTDFTTASHTLFAHPDVRFVNVNVGASDVVKLSGLSLRADAREALRAMASELGGWGVDESYAREVTRLRGEWDDVVRAHCDTTGADDEVPSQAQVVGLVNETAGARDVVVGAAGSLPGDLHRLWRARDPEGYHVEYGYSCMGYEIAGGVGAAMAAPDRRVFVLVGDGSYLMMASEIVTAVAEGLSLVIVLVDNHGYASIGALSESLGTGRFGTQRAGGHDGALGVDLAANAASLGAHVVRARTVADLRAALQRVSAEDGVHVVHVECSQQTGAPPGGAWWDVPVAQVSAAPSVQAARTAYERSRRRQRPYLAPGDR